ncbi:MAG: hypothetical protein R3F61_34095 [Myxococcota bacterium]
MILVSMGLLGCGGAPDHVVGVDTSGTAARCVSATLESVRQTGVRSPSVNAVNTRALARTVDGETVQWDFMWQPHGEGPAAGDAVVLLVDTEGRAVGMSRECPAIP